VVAALSHQLGLLEGSNDVLVQRALVPLAPRGADVVAFGTEAFVSLPELVETLSRREGNVEVAEWLVQLAYRVTRAHVPTHAASRMSTGQAHTAHLDRKSGLLNSAPPPRAVAPDPRATHEGVERFLHQVVVLPRGVLGH